MQLNTTCSIQLVGWNALYIVVYISRMEPPPKNGEIALWPSTDGAIPYFLVLRGSELSITEITEYKCFSPLKPSREFKYKSE